MFTFCTRTKAPHLWYVHYANFTFWLLVNVSLGRRDQSFALSDFTSPSLLRVTHQMGRERHPISDLPFNGLIRRNRITSNFQGTNLKVNYVEGEVGEFGDTGQVVTTAGHVTSTQESTVRLPSNIFYNDEGGEIKDYLSRPQLIVSTSLATTDTATTFSKYDVMTLLQNYFSEKITGKYSVSFDLILRLEVSADRFHSGRYMLCYMPCFHGTVGSSATGVVSTFPNWAYAHAATLTQCSQLQHVELDVNVDKEVVLRVPWRFINPFIELGVKGNNMASGASPPGYGFFWLRPYYPLQYGSSGSSVATANIWMSLDNVKFYGTADWQSGIGEKEVESVGEGPISGPLTSITKTLDAASDIPYVGHYVKPASWVTEALARAAKHFGFSSPAIQKGVTPFVNAPHFYGAHSDVPRPVQPLSSTINNSVSTDSQYSGSKVDEMSIDYLKSIYAYKTAFDFTTSTATNTVIFETGVNPLTPYSTTTYSDGTNTFVGQHHGPMGYIASRFKYWRGSIKYRLKLVKTEFHTGKLLVYWSPLNAKSQTYASPANVNDTYFRYRQVIDISKGNEFEFEVPYMSPRPWKSVLPYENGDFNSTYNLNNASLITTDSENGFLGVIVLDTLRAPDTASTTVRVLVEMAGGTDFEISCPMCNDLYTSSEGVASTLVSGRPMWNGNFQMNTGNAHTVTSYAFGDHKPRSYEDSVKVAEIAGGEHVSSLRKLLKRYTTLFIASSTSQYYAINLWSAMGLNYDLGNSVWIATNPSRCDDFVHYSAMFCFFRGSMRFKYYADAAGTGTASLSRQQHQAILVDASNILRSSAASNAAVSPLSTSYAPSNPYASPRVLAVSTLSEALEFSIPFYSRDSNYTVQAMFNADGTAFASNGAPTGTIGAPAVSAIVSTLSPTTLTLNMRVDRSIGEDASLSFFVSCPPLYDPRQI